MSILLKHVDDGFMTDESETAPTSSTRCRKAAAKNNNDSNNAEGRRSSRHIIKNYYCPMVLAKFRDKWRLDAVRNKVDIS